MRKRRSRGVNLLCSDIQRALRSTRCTSILINHAHFTDTHPHRTHLHQDLPHAMNDGSRRGGGAQLDAVLTLLYGDDNLYYNVVRRTRQPCFLAGRCRGGSRFLLASHVLAVTPAVCFFFLHFFLFFTFCVINYTFLLFFITLSLHPPTPAKPLVFFLCVVFLMMYDNSYISLFLLQGEGESFVFPH